MENTVRKGEIARYKQFLLFPQCFQKACFPGASKCVIVWEWVKWWCLFLERVENSAGKEKKMLLPAFSLFPQCFPKYSFLKSWGCLVELSLYKIYQIEKLFTRLRKKRILCELQTLSNSKLTLSQTTNYGLPNWKSLQKTILNLMKKAESSPKELKTLWEKEKLLVMSNFSFSHSVLKRLLLQIHKNQSLFRKGINKTQKLKFILGKVEN